MWLLTGLWHGAAWTFVLWGAWFLLLLAGEKLLWGRGLARLPRVFRHGYTLLAVTASWVLFRSPSAHPRRTGGHGGGGLGEHGVGDLAHGVGQQHFFAQPEEEADRPMGEFGQGLLPADDLLGHGGIAHDGPGHQLGKQGHRAGLWGAAVLGLGLLGWFKYAGFLCANLSRLGVRLDLPQIVLPIGISFFTFQGKASSTPLRQARRRRGRQK